MLLALRVGEIGAFVRMQRQTQFTLDSTEMVSEDVRILVEGTGRQDSDGAVTPSQRRSAAQREVEKGACRLDLTAVALPLPDLSSPAVCEE